MKRAAAGRFAPLATEQSAADFAFDVFLTQQAVDYQTADGASRLESERMHTITAGPELMWAEQRRAFAEAEANQIIAQRDGSAEAAKREAALLEAERLQALETIRRIPPFINPDGRAQMLAAIIHNHNLDTGAAA